MSAVIVGNECGVWSVRPNWEALQSRAIDILPKECWLVGDRLIGYGSGGAYVDLLISDLTENPVVDVPDNLDCRPGDLCVTHFGFCGYSGVLEFLNRCIAKRFDLSTRHVGVKFGEPAKRHVERQIQAVDATGQLLQCVGAIHFLIPKAQRLTYRSEAG